MSATERWLPIAGYEGCYSVSDLGRVRSEARVVVRRNGQAQTVRERILKSPPNEDGYPNLKLCRSGVHKTRLVHHLVLEAFVGPRPPGTQCCHGDGNPGNARLGNLRWDFPIANSADSIAHGVTLRGEDVPGAKLTADQVRAIRADGRPQADIAREFRITPSNVSRIKSRDVWAHL